MRDWIATIAQVFIAIAAVAGLWVAVSSQKQTNAVLSEATPVLSQATVVLDKANDALSIFSLAHVTFDTVTRITRQSPPAVDCNNPPDSLDARYFNPMPFPVAVTNIKPYSLEVGHRTPKYTQKTTQEFTQAIVAPGKAKGLQVPLHDIAPYWSEITGNQPYFRFSLAFCLKALPTNAVRLHTVTVGMYNIRCSLKRIGPIFLDNETTTPFNSTEECHAHLDTLE